MEKLVIEAVDRKDLTEKDFVGIHEVMQDMWASEAGLGELAQCTECGKMMSKEEAFRDLPKEVLAEHTVTSIMYMLWTNTVPCVACSGKTRLIYDPYDNVEKIKDRVLNSVDAFLVLCKSETKGIVGFEEAYIDSLERMFHLDFMDHYENVGLPEIRKRVHNILGYTPDKMMLFSSLWLLEPYRNFQNLFETLHQFSRKLPEKYQHTPGLTEFNRWGTTHRMSGWISQGISLGIEDDPLLRAKMTNVWEKYNCDLVLYANPVWVYKESFTNGIKHFLKSIRKQTEPANETIKTSGPTALLPA